MIVKQDGSTKNDCERNAAKRYLADLRRDHPHLKIIVTEGGASRSNAPHIHELQRHDMRYILGEKPKDHEYLFELVDEAVASGEITEFEIADPEQAAVHHCFRFLNNVPLNKCSKDKLRVNFLEYWQTDKEGKVSRRFSWVTDFEIGLENAYDLMRARRANSLLLDIVLTEAGGSCFSDVFSTFRSFALGNKRKMVQNISSEAA